MRAARFAWFAALALVACQSAPTNTINGCRTLYESEFGEIVVRVDAEDRSGPAWSCRVLTDDDSPGGGHEWSGIGTWGHMVWRRE